jgi:transposase
MREKLKELTSRSPRALGLDRSRWTLELLRKHLGEKAPETNSGTWRMVNRLGLTHTRGQGYALSPDEQFEAKRAFIEGVRVRSGADRSGKSEKVAADRLFYLDELTYELHPTTGSAWSGAGNQPTAERGTCSQRQGRLLSAMDTESGQLFYRQKQSVGRTDLIGLYREMVDACEGDSDPARLWVVQDNAPFHFHAEVLEELEPQVWPRAHPSFEYPIPGQWPDPTDAALSSGDLPVQIVPLPTYASWLNPIERLWRWLKQEVLHLHPYAANWKKLKRGVRRFLDRFIGGSEALLSYTGLSQG